MKTPGRVAPLLVAILLALHSGAGIDGAQAAISLPDIGETTESFLSTKDEQRYGEAFMRSIRHSLPLMDDAEVQNYVESLGNRLAANASAGSRRFFFFPVRDPAINAFAGPGGYIGINTGLILTSDSEAELASVFAHEIAHVTQRHLARAFEEVSRMSVPMTAALIAALILGSRSDSSQVTEAAIAATTAGSIQKQINFTRAHEQEADRVGLQILADSGYEPRAMPRFFERLQRASQYYDNLNLEFLRTHPVTVSRIADTRSRAEQYPELRESVTDSFDLVRERVRVLQQGDPQKSIAWYRNALGTEGDADRNALRYGLAVALNAAGRHAEAREELAPLIAREPERPTYQLALADAARGERRLYEALAISAHMLAIYPYHLPLTIHRAETLLEAGKPADAIRLIGDYMDARPPRPELYRMLAQARDMMNDRPAAQQALAEHYYLVGELGSALEQLQMALRQMPKEDVRAERIRARIDVMRSEWRARAKLTGETTAPPPP
ncbi:MAG: M48 family metalloprotease [Gammaproteobacteria bacterium]|jgi:predicted Zn-dependent protease|nr:M48 family metalloprotease [Gammaproteobacteria bacterium]